MLLRGHLLAEPVPAELAEGEHWLDLQLIPLQADATPSRPVLYPIEHLP